LPDDLFNRVPKKVIPTEAEMGHLAMTKQDHAAAPGKRQSKNFFDRFFESIFGVMI
jgi:hypothetical protein